MNFKTGNCYLFNSITSKNKEQYPKKSTKNGKPRCLKIGGKCITWSQFREAFNWEQQSCSLPLHEKLTVQHFDLDSASIMRNKLAEDVLDSKMLFLMQVKIYFNPLHLK